MEALANLIRSEIEHPQSIDWNQYESYLNHFDEKCMESQEFFDLCGKISDDLRENHREMYKNSAMRCVRDVANSKEDMTIEKFNELSEPGCIVEVCNYFLKNILNDKMSDFEKGVFAYFGLMFAYILQEQTVHIIPDTFFGGKLYLDNGLNPDTTVDNPDFAFFDFGSKGFFFNMMKVCFLHSFKPKIFNHIKKCGNRIALVHPFFPDGETLLDASRIKGDFDVNDYITDRIRDTKVTLRMLDRENPKIMRYKYSFNESDEALINLFFMYYNNFDYLSVTIPWRKNLLSKILPKIKRYT